MTSAITIISIMLLIGLIIILGVITSTSSNSSTLNLPKILIRGFLTLIALGIAWKLLSLVLNFGSIAHGL